LKYYKDDIGGIWRVAKNCAYVFDPKNGSWYSKDWTSCDKAHGEPLPHIFGPYIELTKEEAFIEIL